MVYFIFWLNFATPHRYKKIANYFLFSLLFSSCRILTGDARNITQSVIMKIIRNKRVKKILAFYRNYFEFRTPYQVLIDGTFSLAALNFHIKLDEQVAKLFEAEVKLCTTSCIISESEALSEFSFSLLSITLSFISEYIFLSDFLQ